MRKLFVIYYLFCIAILSMLFGAGCSQEQSYEKRLGQNERTMNQAVEENPKLPYVMLIGDSISSGYTDPVRKLLAGKANVYRPLKPDETVKIGGPITIGLEFLDKWLGDKKWDVIHFNWGLHDMKYVDEKGEMTSPEKGRQQVPIEDYEKNLEELVNRLKKTGAILIFATTTPVPEGAFGRVKGDAERYNAVAVKVMRKNGVIIDDLYSFALPRLKEIQKERDVHYTEDGYQLLGEQVASSILKALEQRGR